MRINKLLALLLSLVLMALPVFALADAGDFSGDYDWGGDTDWGSSDWDTDYDSDWGSSSWFDDDDDDFFVASTGSSDDDDGGFYVGVVVIVVVVIIASVLRGKKKGGNANPGAAQAAPVQAAPKRTVTNMTLADLKAMDPAFSESDMKEKLGNLYIKMQQCWQDKDWEPMRADLDDGIYNQMAMGVEAKRRKNQTNYVERIAILGVDLRGFAQDEKNDILIAELRTRIVDYTVDDATGNLISGSKTAEKFMTYEWTLIRTKGAKTAAQTGESAKNCPNCGAPLDINSSTRCPYCGSIVRTEEHDWVLKNIKGLAQQTRG